MGHYLPWAMHRALARALTKMYRNERLSWTEEQVRELDAQGLRQQRGLARGRTDSALANFPVDELEPRVQEELEDAEVVISLIDRILGAEA